MNKVNLVAVVVLFGACASPPQRVESSRTDGPDKAYTVDLPVGWISQVTQTKKLLVTRDGILLEYILITKSPLKEAFPKNKKAASEAMLPAELAELQITEIKSEDQYTAALTVIENEPAEIAGRPGFRFRVRYKNNRGLEIQRVVCGLADKSAYYQMQFSAPMLYYFDHYYPDFQKTVASFQLSDSNEKTSALKSQRLLSENLTRSNWTGH